MTRQRYETPQDVERAYACARDFAVRINYEIWRLSGQYERLDYLLLPKRSGDLPVWLDVKCRSHSYGEYPTLILSAAKWREGVTMAQTTGGHFAVLVRYLDADYAYVYDPLDVKAGKIFLSWGGRTVHTRDRGDIEPVMEIPITLFGKVSQ